MSNLSQLTGKNFEQFVLAVGNIVTLDFSKRQNIGIVYGPSPSGPISLVVNNIPQSGLFSDKVFTFSVFVDQGTTPYGFTSITLNGTAGGTATRPIKWQGGSAPTGNASSWDVFNFICVNTGLNGNVLSAYSVFGNLNGNYTPGGV